MILRILAVLFGIGFIFAGVAGFLPTFMVDGLLFGYFEINTMHNLVHIISGVIAIMAATSLKYSKLFFQIFGIIYLVVAITGFWRDGDLFILHVNMADNVLHLVIGLVALFLGFSMRSKKV